MRCDRFDGFPCLTDGKADAHVRCVRPALKHANVKLITHAKVERLETDPGGRSVTRVHVNRRGAPESYSADIVVVSCGATNSAALLLKSASDQHPRGLANSSDVVGRHYMAHINSGVIAISQTPNTTKFQKTLGINDYYWGAEDSELPLGHIQMLGKSDKDILRAGAPWFAPGLALDYMAKHAIDFWLTTEDLPHPSNRVTVDRGGRIRVAKTYHNLEPHKRLLGKLRQLMGPLGCHDSRDPDLVDPRPADPARGQRTSVRHRALRRGPGQLRARRQLPRPRPRQPVRRRHELLPVEQRRESGADRDGQRAARRRSPARAARVPPSRSPRRPKATPSQWRCTHEDRREGRKQHRQGPCRRLRRDRRDDRLEHARGQAARPGPSTAPARATAKALGIASFEDAIAQARWNDVSHWGYGTGWGIVRGLLDAAGLPPAKATAAHGAAIWGSAQVTLPALDIAPPIVFWPARRSRSTPFTTPCTRSRPASRTS